MIAYLIRMDSGLLPCLVPNFEMGSPDSNPIPLLIDLFDKRFDCRLFPSKVRQIRNYSPNS